MAPGATSRVPTRSAKSRCKATSSQWFTSTTTSEGLSILAGMDKQTELAFRKAILMGQIEAVSLGPRLGRWFLYISSGSEVFT